MNIRDLRHYPVDVQQEVITSVRHVAAGHFTHFPPHRCPQWLFWAWRAKEQVQMLCRVAWRKVVGPDREVLKALDAALKSPG